jgi:selenocysteine lyase/cysteine desulfurase
MDRLKRLRGVSFNTSFDPDQFCAIANFSIDGGDPTKITEHLMAKHKIIATPIIHDEFTGIRITPNIFTTLRELDRFCSVIENMVAKGLSKGLRL